MQPRPQGHLCVRGEEIDDPGKGSALYDIELTYHDVTVFAIPEFKSLEVLEKKYFCINIIVNQPQN